MKRIYDQQIEQFAKNIPFVDTSDVFKARRQINKINETLSQYANERPARDSVQEIDLQIPSKFDGHTIKIRLYKPNNAPNNSPVYLNFHGGGFILGSLDSDHARTLAISHQCNIIGVTVDYRLAPEHPYPSSLQDCYSALLWLSDEASNLDIDSTKIIVGGPSAGGNLASAVCLFSRDNNGPSILYQILNYPVLDETTSTVSMKNSNDTYIITKQNVIDMWQYYLGCPTDEVEYYAAPFRAHDVSNLPPAYIMTCEHDPLRDEGIIYALNLMNSGVPVELRNYPGTVHGFDYIIPSNISNSAIKHEISIIKNVLQNTN